MPPEDDMIQTRLSGYFYENHYDHPNIRINLNKEQLYHILHMWPVYQQDDIGRRVVAIYEDPSSAQRLQDMIDHHGYRVEPIIQAAPPRNRLRKIFGGPPL